MLRILFAAALMTSFLTVGMAGTDASEEALVKQAVMDAYVKGIHTNRDTVTMKKGFHDAFIMFINKDGGVNTMTRDDWADRIDAGKRKNPDRKTPKVVAKFPMISVEGNAAVARIELYRDDKHAYTDFMSLYKGEDGWKIIGKIFQSHRK